MLDSIFIKVEKAKAALNALIDMEARLKTDDWRFRRSLAEVQEVLGLPSIEIDCAEKVEGTDGSVIEGLTEGLTELETIKDCADKLLSIYWKVLANKKDFMDKFLQFQDRLGLAVAGPIRRIKPDLSRLRDDVKPLFDQDVW